MIRADDFEKQIGLSRERGKLVDPRPQNEREVVGGNLSPLAVWKAAESRAETALRDFRAAGATRPDVWRLMLRVLDGTDAPTTEGQ